MSPQRVQRRRVKGWRPPVCSCGCVVTTFVRYATRAEVVELYRLTLSAPTPGMRMAYPSNGRFLDAGPGEIRAELAGHDLMCWCPLEDADGSRVPCHADVLLDIANHQADR